MQMSIRVCSRYRKRGVVGSAFWLFARFLLIMNLATGVAYPMNRNRRYRARGIIKDLFEVKVSRECVINVDLDTAR